MAIKTDEGYPVDNTLPIHQYYMDIINCMPNVVYWLDAEGQLKGCNQRFIKWLGMKQMSDLVGTPYEQMAKLTSWPEKRIEAFRLDDLSVIFSGEAQYDVDERPVRGRKGEVMYFRATRVPLFDEERRVTGVVVVLTERAPYPDEIDLPAEKVSKTITHEVKSTPAVLMVEDNVIAQKVEEALLQSLHCQVDIAASGDQAMTLFDPGKYDLVFMDIGLQDTSGYVVAKKIRQMEKNTAYHVPIIALTSYEAERVKYDCEDYFMDGVLTKPITPIQAQQIIRHFVNHENVCVEGLKRAKERSRNNSCN